MLGTKTTRSSRGSYVRRICVKRLKLSAQKIQAQTQWTLRGISPEDLPTRDVVKIFTGARYAFAPHGGGNAWIVSAPAGACFLELFGGDRGSNNRQYHNLATLVRLRYYEDSPPSSICKHACLQKIIHIGKECLEFM